MNKKIIKLNRKLQAIAITSFVIGVMLCWFVYHSYKTFERPFPGMRITFEMYEAQYEILNALVFQLLPLLIVLLFLTGLMVFSYLRKRSEFDQKPPNQNAKK